MKLGIIPICEKSVTTDPVWVRKFVSMLEEENVESVWMPEHVVVAENYSPLYEYSEDGKAPMTSETLMPDPLHWLSFAAAWTERLRLGTSVLVGPQHSAAILAKRLATVDALSGGRLEAGIGIGWQIEEYEAVGVPYSRRGERLEEVIGAMRTLWTQDPATYEGDFVKFQRVFCDTKPAQAKGVPIIIGGSSEAAAQRAGRCGDGFFPYVISPKTLAARMHIIKESMVRNNREYVHDFSLTVWPGSYRQDGTFDIGLARAYRDVGATRFILAAYEAGGSDIERIRFLIKKYQDQILGQL